MAKIKAFKSSPHYPPLYSKAQNWLKYGAFLPLECHKKMVKYWFNPDHTGFVRGFPVHYTQNRNLLGTKAVPICGNWKQKFDLYTDILRRLREGKLEKVAPHQVDHVTPIYMLTKLRSWANPSLGEKNRTIFDNSSIKNGGQISLNDGVPPEKRKMRFPPILQAIIHKIRAAQAISKLKTIYQGAFDIENGFENLFVPPADRRLLGINIHGILMRSWVGEYGEAAKPKQMHTLLIILIQILDIVAIRVYGKNFQLVNCVLKYMDDGGVFSPSQHLGNSIMNFIIQHSWTYFGLKMKNSKIKWCMTSIDRFLGFTFNHDLTTANDSTIDICADRKAKLKYKALIIIHAHKSKTSIPFIILHQFHGSCMSVSEIRWPLKALTRCITRFITDYQAEKVGLMDPIYPTQSLINTVISITNIILYSAPVTVAFYESTLYDHNIHEYSFQHHIYTDSSDTGWGGIDLTTGAWWFGFWSQSIVKDKTIHWKEAMAATTALVHFAPKFTNKRILLRVDNESVHYGFINKKYKQTEVDIIINYAYQMAAAKKFYFFSKWISTTDNKLADLLSRFKLAEFKKWCSSKNISIQLQPCPVKIPPIDFSQYITFQSF